MTALRISSARLPHRQREITVTAENLVGGVVVQGHAVTPLMFKSGVGTAVVHSGACDVYLYYEGGLRQIEHLDRVKWTWPRLGHRTPKMPHRHAEYT